MAPRSEAGTRYRELLAHLSPETAEPNSQQTAEQTDDTNADSTNPRCRAPLCTGTLHRDADLPRPSLSVILYRSPLSRRAVSTPPRRQTNDSS